MCYLGQSHCSIQVGSAYETAQFKRMLEINGSRPGHANWKRLRSPYLGPRGTKRAQIKINTIIIHVNIRILWGCKDISRGYIGAKRLLPDFTGGPGLQPSAAREDFRILIAKINEKLQILSKLLLLFSNSPPKSLINFSKNVAANYWKLWIIHLSNLWKTQTKNQGKPGSF